MTRPGARSALYVCEIGTADAARGFAARADGPVPVTRGAVVGGDRSRWSGVRGRSTVRGGRSSSVTVTEGTVASIMSVRVACSAGA